MSESAKECKLEEVGISQSWTTPNSVIGFPRDSNTCGVDSFFRKGGVGFQRRNLGSGGITSLLLLGKMLQRNLPFTSIHVSVNVFSLRRNLPQVF